MRTTIRTTVSRDPDLVALLAKRRDYPGPTAILDSADRAWLRSVGVDVSGREETVPLHEAARLARNERQEKTVEKKHRTPKKGA